MKGRPQIVLDIAGVLLSNMSLTCWKDMSEETNLSAESLKVHFAGIKRKLWTGMMREEEFWQSLKEMYPELSISRAKDILYNSIVPYQPLNTLSDGVSSQISIYSAIIVRNGLSRI